MNIHVNLFILRIKNNLYQKDVAKAIGVKLTTYQAYENHRATPPIHILKNIIDFYEVKDLYTFLFNII